MKCLFTLCLTLICLSAVAQHKNRRNLNQSIDDDGKIMRVDITGDVDGRELNYHGSFDVSRLSADAKQALTQRITDSLGISHLNTGSNSLGVHARVSANNTPSTVKPNSNRQNLHSSIADDGKILRININGRQGDQNIQYNRSFDISGMSAQQKENLIKRITDSLGVSRNVHTKLN